MDALHPSVPRLRARLPGARGLARVHGLSPWGVAEGQPLLLHADTLRIDGEEQRCTLTFRGAFPVPADEALAGLRVLAGVELPGEPIVWPAVEEIARAEPPPATVRVAPLLGSTITLSEEDFISIEGEALDGTLALEPDQALGEHAPTLPFRSGRRPRRRRAPANPRPPDSQRPRRTLALDVDAIQDFGPAMPFRDAADRAPAAPASPPTPPVSPEPPPLTAAPAVKKKRGWPWAPAPPPPRAPPPPKAEPPTASPALKKGLYGKFGSDR